MKNYWIQALLFKDRDDYRYDKTADYQPWLICADGVKGMLRRAPAYIRLTLSTRPLETGSQWETVKSNIGYIARNVKTGQRSTVYSEMEDWLLTLDSPTFWVAVEAVDAATYRKGL